MRRYQGRHRAGGTADDQDYDESDRDRDNEDMPDDDDEPCGCDCSHCQEGDCELCGGCSDPHCTGPNCAGDDGEYDGENEQRPHPHEARRAQSLNPRAARLENQIARLARRHAARHHCSYVEAYAATVKSHPQLFAAFNHAHLSGT
jgi:hypothetical protein